MNFQKIGTWIIKQKKYSITDNVRMEVELRIDNSFEQMTLKGILAGMASS